MHSTAALFFFSSSLSFLSFSSPERCFHAPLHSSAEHASVKHASLPATRSNPHPPTACRPVTPNDGSLFSTYKPYRNSIISLCTLNSPLVERCLQLRFRDGISNTHPVFAVVCLHWCRHTSLQNLAALQQLMSQNPQATLGAAQVGQFGTPQIRMLAAAE